MRRHIGVRRMAVLAIRGALPRLRGRRGGGARGRIGVPKGLNRSDSTELAEVQAIHWLQWVSKKPRPVSFSLIYASTLGIGRNHAS
jgi:hypothetical protein